MLLRPSQKQYLDTSIDYWFTNANQDPHVMTSSTFNATWETLPLDSVYFSDEFSNAAMAAGFEKFGDILTLPLSQLISQNWMTTVLFSELHNLISNLSAETELLTRIQSQIF